MRLDKTTIPFAWYWEGKPLRGNQIRPVYTGPAPCSSSTLRYDYPSHPAAEGVHSCSTSAFNTHECLDHQVQTPESDCCSSETYACCESAEETETETCCCSLCCDSEHTTTSSTTPTCTQPSESASSSPSASASASTCSSASSTPSTIHYHAHAYFCYPGYDSPSQSPYISEPPCTCASCQSQSYYAYPPAPAPATRTTKHQCPDCPPPPPPPPPQPQSRKKTPKTTTSVTDAYHGQRHPSEHHEHYPHHPHYPRTKAGARAHFEDISEDDTATISSNHAESVCSDVEKEACECCGPAWLYRDHPAFRKR